MDRNSYLKDISEIALLLSEKDSDSCSVFLSEILTPNEIETLAKRWRILKMLSKGISQRTIAKELNVSLCKVTRGSKIFKKNDVANIIKGVKYEY